MTHWQSFFQVGQLPPLVPLSHPVAAAAGVTLLGLRLDLLAHPLQGNKAFKLGGFFHDLDALPTRVTVFGGAYSNLVRAAAIACYNLGIPCRCLIRGFAPECLSPILEEAQRLGATIIWLSPLEYRAQQQLYPAVPGELVIPEGGATLAGVRGVTPLGALLATHNPDYLALVTATGTTMAGVVAGLEQRESPQPPEVIGISVLKGEDQLTGQVSAWLADLGQGGAVDWQVVTGYHFGGYAKTNAELKAFQQDCAQRWGWLPEHVYDAKLLYGVLEMVAQGQFRRDSKVLVVLG